MQASASGARKDGSLVGAYDKLGNCLHPEHGTEGISLRVSFISSCKAFYIAKTGIQLTVCACRNAVAISDGPLDKATGRIFFYLTDFDQTAIDLAVCQLSA